MALNALLDSLVHECMGKGSIVVDESWAQGRSLFGGIQVAVMLRLLEVEEPDATDRVRAIQVSFFNAVAAGKITLSHQLLRAGRTAYHQLQLWSNDQLCCQAVVMLGQGRESAVESSHLLYPAESLPAIQALEVCKDLPFIPGVTPAFTRHLHMRFGFGGIPFTGANTDETAIYLKFRESTNPGLPALVALADAAPSPVLSKLKKPAPASSAFWTLDVVDPDGLSALSALSEWTVLHNEIVHSQAGYVVQNGSLWCAETHKLLAVTQQTVAVFG